MGLCDPGLAHSGLLGASGLKDDAGLVVGLFLLALACLLLEFLLDLDLREDDISLFFLSHNGVQTSLAEVCPPGDGVVPGELVACLDGGVRGVCSPKLSRTTSSP